MFRELRVVGEDAGGVVVDFESFRDGFNDNTGAGSVGDDPMEVSNGELVAVVGVGEVDVGEKIFGFFDRGATAEEPRKKFELSNIILALDGGVINGVITKKKAGYAETFFVDGIIKEREIFGLILMKIISRNIGDMSDTHDGIMIVKQTYFAEIKWKIMGNDNSFFAIRKIKVKIATKIMVFGMISGCCAHVLLCPFCF